MRRTALFGLALLAAACTNAGRDTVTSITATGTVTGFVYFDADGSRSLTGSDTALANVRVVLLAAGDTLHAVLSTSSQQAGRFRFGLVPVGAYTLRLDSTTFGPGLGVLKIDSASFSVRPGDSIAVNAGVGFPSLSIAAARALPAGRTVFLTGTALNTYLAFSDSVVHLQDTSGAIRLTRLRNAINTADSVRVRGTTARRDSLPVLDDVHVFALGFGLLDPALVLTDTVAAGADSGRADARLIAVKNVGIKDTATVTGGFRLTVSDSSGTLEVLLDPAADTAFRAARLPGVYIPGNHFDIYGVLQPSGSGTWRLKPRAATDLVKRP